MRWWLALVWLAACDGHSGEARAPEPRTERPPEPPEAPPPAEDEKVCEAGAPNVLLAPAPAVSAVAIDPGLVAFPEDADTLVVQPIDARARPDGEASRVEATRADGLFALRRVGERHVVLTEGMMDGQRAMSAQLLDARGRAVGRAVRVPLPGPLTSRRVRAGDGVLYVARGHEGSPPALDRFTVGPTGIAHAEVPIGERTPAEDRRVEILALAVEGDRYAVAFRLGAPEAPDSVVMVATAGGEEAVDALHHALVIESFGFVEGELAAIAAFETARQAIIRPLDAHGRATTLAPGAEIPAPFTADLHGAVSLDDHELALDVRDAAGDRIERVRVASLIDGGVADVARTAGGFLVAFAGPEANGRAVNASLVACAR